MDERVRFEDFHRRVDRLVQQLMAQSTEDKMLGRRAEELEKRLLSSRSCSMNAKSSSRTCVASSRSRAKLKLIYASR